ncbi:MAG: glutathione synthase [Myxococcota bacterium]|nr:glutathione synthase [Myxococcota bacterium]
MQILVIMDPIEFLEPDKDTTIGFIMSAQRAGHRVEYACLEDLFIENGTGGVRARRIEVAPSSRPFYHMGPVEMRPLSAYDSVWMRKDPPVDRAYLHATHILDLAGTNTLVVNSPQGLRFANEKLYALQFPEFIPSTLVTRNLPQIRQKLDENGRPLIVKPVDGHGGAGVFLLQPGDRNVNSILETLTDNGRRWVVVQQYLSEARIGDKRVIMIDGHPVGAILRVPQDNDNRGNIHVGGTVQPTTLTETEQSICAVVGPRLRQDGLWFVGLDLIGERLTEVNVTSPTGIREVEALTGEDLGAAYVKWVEAKCAS